MPTISPAAKGWIWNLPSVNSDDVFGDGLGAAVEGVERLRKARGQAPVDLGHGLRDRGLRDRRGRKADAGRLQELTTFHACSPPPCAWLPSGPASPGLAIRHRQLRRLAKGSIFRSQVSLDLSPAPSALAPCAAAWHGGTAACQAAAPGSHENDRSSPSPCSRASRRRRPRKRGRSGSRRKAPSRPSTTSRATSRRVSRSSSDGPSARRRRRGAPSSSTSGTGMIKGLLRGGVRRDHGVARHHREAPSPHRLLEALLPHSGGLRRRARSARPRRRRAGSARRQAPSARSPTASTPPSSRSVIPRREVQTYGKLEEANLDLFVERLDLVLGDKLACDGSSTAGRQALLPLRRRRALRSRLLRRGRRRRAAQGATPSSRRCSTARSTGDRRRHLRPHPREVLSLRHQRLTAAVL